MGYFFCNENFILKRNMYQDSGGNVESSIYFEFHQYSPELCNKIQHLDIRNLGFSENK